ncbi:hypothetical protein ACFX11_034762 [Malus domestica]
MAAYLAQTQLLLQHFHYQIIQIPGAVNSHADTLACLASVVEDKIGRKIQVELLAAPSTMVTNNFNAKDITGQHSTKMPSEYPAYVISVNDTQLFLTPLPSRSLL